MPMPSTPLFAAALVLLSLLGPVSAYQVSYELGWYSPPDTTQGCRASTFLSIFTIGPHGNTGALESSIRPGNCPKGTPRTFTASQAACRFSTSPSQAGGTTYKSTLCVDVPIARLPSYKGILGLPVDEPLYQALMLAKTSFFGRSANSFTVYYSGFNNSGLNPPVPGCTNPDKPPAKIPDLTPWATSFGVALVQDCNRNLEFGTRCSENQYFGCSLLTNMGRHPAYRPSIADFPIPGVKYTTLRKTTTKKPKTTTKNPKATTKRNLATTKKVAIVRTTTTTKPPRCGTCPAGTKCAFDAAAAVNRTTSLGLGKPGRTCSFFDSDAFIREWCSPSEPGNSIASCSAQCLATCAALGPTMGAPTGIEFPMVAYFSVLPNENNWLSGGCMCGQTCFPIDLPGDNTYGYYFEIPGACKAT